MTPTGNLDGTDLVLRRTFTTGIDDVWASVTESDRLARWFGTWTGDPTTGSVMVSMNAEAEPAPAVEYAIDVCDPPRVLSVSAVDGGTRWLLTVELAEAAGVTTLTLTQRDVDPDIVQYTGPGWEWYLDRLVAATIGRELPTLAEFESTYMTMGPLYEAMRGTTTDTGRPTDA